MCYNERMEAPLAEDSRGEAPLRIVTPTNVLNSQGLGLKMCDQFDQDAVALIFKDQFDQDAVALIFKGRQLMPAWVQ